MVSVGQCSDSATGHMDCFGQCSDLATTQVVSLQAAFAIYSHLILLQLCGNTTELEFMVLI